MYAGFWKRFVAWFIDYLLLVVVIYGLAFIIGITAGVGTAASGANQNDIIGLVSMFSGFFILLAIVLPWLYYALMESSVKQATLGKTAMGIKVTDLAGNRISFGRATGRYFAKMLSGLILLIGYIIAGFTEKKQALHDFIAGTLVVNSNNVR